MNSKETEPILKNEKIDICFENLCYDVKIKKKLGYFKSNSSFQLFSLLILFIVIER